MDRRQVQTTVGQRSGWGISLIVGAIGVLVGAAPAYGQDGAQHPADAWDAWQIHDALQTDTRLPLNLHKAREFIERCGPPIPAEVWREATAFAAVPVEGEAVDARRAAEAKFHQAVDAVAQQLLATLPPVVAVDRPDDNGRRLAVLWRPQSGVRAYRIERQALAAHGEGAQWIEVGQAAGGARRFIDERDVRPGQSFRYRVTAMPVAGPPVILGESAAASARLNWLNSRRRWQLTLAGLLSAIILAYIWRARHGGQPRIRRIAGLEAVDEAVGRATEMGRPILFIPGIMDMDDIQTVAGLIVLGHVAESAARHGATVEVPNARSLVMATARETVAGAFRRAGRAAAYDESHIYYVTNDQFGYVAGVAGAMLREQPAACFYMGSFRAEALLFAETAHAAGSIQIAGTAQAAALPFFVVACDYTLIGEEFFAASAYLSRDAEQVGSLKGQDVGKVLAVLLIIVGTGLATMAALSSAGPFGWAGAATDWMVNELLNTQG
jgi:hypothetical protein